MLLYILKSAACLAILLAFYKIFLERENMHTFKRFYLLGTLLAAFIIPFVTFVEYVEIPTVTAFKEQSTTHFFNVPSTEQEETATDYIPVVLWCVYAIGIAVFGFKFIKNLSRIIQRIRKNPKVRINRITNVLLQDSVIPHTFFNYIFLNKQKFEAKEIPAEVLLHEETHARQKHSFDVLFIEFIQLLYWFNPFIFVLKKAVKLNHEFLADREVVRKGIKPSIYQNILLEFSSNSLQPQLANAINYSSIKKRFTVMKTKTSKKSILLRSLLILPLTALLLFGFSEKKLVELQAPVEMTISLIEQVSAVKTIDIRITKKGEILVQNNLLTSLDNLKSHLQKINTNLTKEQREDVVRVVIMPDAEAPMKILKDIEPILIDYGVSQIDIIGPEKYVNQNLEIKVQEGATKKQIEEYNALAKKYYELPLGGKISRKEIERINFIHGIMTDKQWADAEPYPFPDLSKEQKHQEGATKKQIDEYNALASKYNRMSKDNFTIIGEDVRKLEYIYSMMSAKQRKNAEPFPNFPPPPPPPNNPKAVKGKASTVSPQPPSAPKIKKGKASNIPPIAPVDPIEEVSDIPTPPPPKSPLDHVIEMAKKDAIFYYEGKEISSDKAISLLKKNKKINLRTRHEGLKKPIVELSTKPIIIKK